MLIFKRKDWLWIVALTFGAATIYSLMGGTRTLLVLSGAFVGAIIGVAVSNAAIPFIRKMK